MPVVEGRLLLLQLPFQLAEVIAGLLGLPAELVALVQQLVLGLEFGLLGDALGLPAGQVHDLFGPGLGLYFLVPGRDSTSRTRFFIWLRPTV